MEEVTFMRIRRNGMEATYKVRKPWTEVIDRAQVVFSSTKDIGGPEQPEEKRS